MVPLEVFFIRSLSGCVVVEEIGDVGGFCHELVFHGVQCVSCCVFHILGVQFSDGVVDWWW